jgi:hypothetical protein
MAAAQRGQFGLDSDDLEGIAEMIPMGSAAAYALVEHLWANGQQEARWNADRAVTDRG